MKSQSCVRPLPWLILGLALLGSGCRKSDAEVANGDDPLKSLTVPRLSDRYGTTYWTQKSISDTALWAQAVAYCAGKTEGDHPNCDVVRGVRMLERMSRLPPKSRHNFSLMPNADTQVAHARR